MNEQIDEWMNEQMNERMNADVNAENIILRLIFCSLKEKKKFFNNLSFLPYHQKTTNDNYTLLISWFWYEMEEE